jgi:hypothetical protein
MRKPFKALAPLLISGGIALAAMPAGAAPTGAIDVDSSGHITSAKDISNIVIKDCDGNVTKIEFRDGTNEYDLGGNVDMVWVKAGNNKSGDGPGYGELLDYSDCTATGT